MTSYSPETLRARFTVCTPTSYEPASGNRVISDNTDTRPKTSDTGNMNDITREELRHTLADIEERMDRRVDRMERDTERRSDSFQRELMLRDEALQRESAARHEALKAHISANDAAVKQVLEAVGRVENDFKSVKVEVQSVKASGKEQRRWMAGIGVAIVLGIMGANATIFGGGTTFFKAGIESKEVSELLQQAKQQSLENRLLLEQIKAQQNVTPPPPQTTPKTEPRA